MFESSKGMNWNLGRIVRRRTSSGNTNDDDSYFSPTRIFKKVGRSRTLSTSGDGEAPPPPPPKDEPNRSFSPSFYSPAISHVPKRSTSTESSNESRRGISSGYSKSPHMNFTFTGVHISHASNTGLNSPSATSLPVSSPLPPIPPKFKPFHRPSGPPTKVPTPEERAKARIEAERMKELAHLAIQAEEEKRRARIKAEKEEQYRREEEEEARRKAKIEQDIRIAQLLRKQREHDQAKAEEKFAQEAEERRRVNREKRMQETYKSQAWRIEQERSKEKTLHEIGEGRKRREQKKMEERKGLFDSMKAGHPGGLELSGWMSVQPAGAVTWKRRWFTFDEKALKFFKAQNDTTPMDIITVSNIRNVRECGGPSEEEPGFILNSFVIEEAHSWSLFTDTPDTMDKVIAALIFSSDIPNANRP